MLVKSKNIFKSVRFPQICIIWRQFRPDSKVQFINAKVCTKFQLISLIVHYMTIRLFSAFFNPMKFVNKKIRNLIRSSFQKYDILDTTLNFLQIPFLSHDGNQNPDRHTIRKTEKLPFKMFFYPFQTFLTTNIKK